MMATLWPYLMATIAMVLAAWIWRRSGIRQANAREALRSAQAQMEANDKDRETLERMINVPVLDADAGREWLRDRDPGTK